MIILSVIIFILIIVTVFQRIEIKRVIETRDVHYVKVVSYNETMKELLSGEEYDTFAIKYIDTVYYHIEGKHMKYYNGVPLENGYRIKE